MIRVVKRSGRVEKLDIGKIQKFTSKAVKGLKNVSQSELEIDAKLHFYDMIPTHEIQTALTRTAIDKIDVDKPNWTFVAARLFLYDIYHRVSGFTGYTHLREYFERGEKEGRILVGLKDKYDLDDLNDYIKPERDLQFTYLGIRTLYDRYLIKDREGNPIELPQHLFMGVAMFLAQNEFDSQSWAKRFYDILSKFEVMVATPTLSNARTTRHQLSSCFPKGEKVLTYDGFKNIENVEIGDYVLTHKNRFKKVYQLLQREYNHKLYNFNISGLEKDSLKCTDEHPVLVITADDIKSIEDKKDENSYETLDKNFIDNNTSKWIEAKNIKCGDFVQISFPTHYHNESEILIDNYLKFDTHTNTHTEEFIKKVIPLNSNFMRFIGYYLAIGDVSEDLIFSNFSFNLKDNSVIKDCKNIIENLFGLKVNTIKNSDNSKITLSIHSKSLGEFLNNLIGRFGDKYLDNRVFYAKNQKHILIGVLKSGGFDINDEVIVSSISYDRKLIKQLYNIALRERLIPEIELQEITKPFASTYTLKINYLNDKDFIQLLDIDSHTVDIKNNIKNVRKKQFWFNKNFFAKVDNITTIDTKEIVYNLEVEDDHSYVVNSVAVHNCYIGSTPDNIEGIFDGYKEMALLSKFGGGVGWDWTKVRAMGSSISGHKRAAGGVVPFLKIANDVAIAVDQLGCVAKNSFVRVLDSNSLKDSLSDLEEKYKNYPLNKDDILKLKISIKVIPISKVKVGDLVESFNIKQNRVQYGRVEAVHKLKVEKKSQIKISFENGYIITSKWHPIAVKGKNGYFYKRSDEVKVGEYGVNHKGKSEKIVAIDNRPNISKKYMDLTVEGTNNYFASTDKSDTNFYLTHNTRKGAIAVYLEPWHMDIREFIELKKNAGEERRRTHDLFPALWINDIFMKRIQEDGRWTLFDPYEVPELTELYGEEFEKRYIELESDKSITKEVVSAKALWKEILRNYFETGNPFLTFKDTANRANPNRHSGIIRSSNLCVTADTRLATQFGLVRVDELERMNKKIIATYDYRTDGDRKSYGVGVAECIKMYKTKENAEVYKITTKDGYEIKSTNWHEYYVQRDKAIVKTSLKDIKFTDKLLIQSDVGQFGKEGYYELGVITGFIAGDGTFIKNRVAIVYIYDNETFLKSFIKNSMKKMVERDSFVSNNLNKIKMEDFICNTKKSKKVRFANIQIGKILNKKYKFNKKNRLKVPEFIYKGKRECVVGYLQGVFTSQSTIIDKRSMSSIRLTSEKERFLKEIQTLLINFGIRSKISKIKQKNTLKYIKKSNKKKKVCNFKKLFKLEIDERNTINFINQISFLGEKQKKVLDILKNREKRLRCSKSNRKREYFEVEIKKIEFVGYEDVYDTTQLINHSLIFNGVVTGNCTEIFQNTSPNHYKIKVVFDDFSEILFEEDEIVKIDNGIKKPAKLITALDTINGKNIWIVDKKEFDGETAVCNLASVNLSKINTDKDIARVVPIAIRMLDNVIDLNFYPLAKVKRTNLLNRAIGLGVMGEAQMLAENRIEWGSSEHLKRIDEVMEAISYYAIKTSSDLAIEKGAYPLFDGSDWSKGVFPIDKANENACKLVDRGGIFGYKYDWDALKDRVKIDGMRNGYLMSIAPTSSISILTGTTQTIEPIFKRKWYEKNLSGMIPVVAPNLSPDTWQYYISGYELDQRVLVKVASVRQKWIDQGQSLNIFIALDKASGKYLNSIYMDAWKFGLKSTYYLRSQSPEEIKSTETIEDRSMECVGCQ